MNFYSETAEEFTNAAENLILESQYINTNLAITEGVENSILESQYIHFDDNLTTVINSETGAEAADEFNGAENLVLESRYIPFLNLGELFLVLAL